MKLKNALTASVAGAALFAIAAPAVSTDANAEISNGNKNSLTVSGQIVRGILWADDGTKDDIFMTDGGTTQSRVRWVAKAALSESTTVGGIIELDVPQSNDMANASLSDVSADRISDSADWAIRKTDLSVSNKQFGTVSLGQGDPFTNGITENGNGLGVLWGGVNNRPTAASITFRNSAGTSTSVEAGTVFDNFDMQSRSDRVAYQTPSFNGVTVGGSWIDGSGGDVGVKYSGKFGSVAVDAGVGYVALAGLSTSVDSRIGGSIGLEHDSGINGGIMYAEDDANSTTTRDPQAFGVGIGYTANLYSAGSTSFAVQWYQTEDTVTAGDEGTSWQAGVLQKFDSIGVDTGLMYTHMKYEDNTATSYDDISTVLFNTRLKF